MANRNWCRAEIAAALLLKTKLFLHSSVGKKTLVLPLMTKGSGAAAKLNIAAEDALIK